jgi:hypothetical protein
MTEENGCYFVGMCVETEEDEVLFPLKFHTKDYQEALILTTCIVDGDPRKRVMYADINENYFKD